MRHDRATDEIQTVAALYALGALTQHEARAFEAHLLEGCVVCDGELSRCEEVVGSLGLQVTNADPPPYLRELLAARLEREPKSQKEETSPIVEKPAAPALAPQTRRSRLAFIPWAIAVSFAILAALSYYSLLQLRSEISIQGERLTLLQSESDRVNSLLAEERARSGELELIRSAIRRRGTRMYLLSGQAAAPSASATLFWETDGNRCLVTADLPAAAPGKTYQLWLVTATSKISAGLIRTDASGHATLELDLPTALAGVRSAAITLEPEAGSDQPTGPIYVLGVVS